jgi:small subunit ribosomal protein S1
VLVGARLTFRIIEYKENGRSIILSRRPILEEEQEQKRAAWQERLKVGDNVCGKVVSLHKFGIFVDLDGLQGMIPASEMDWDRSRTGEDLFTVGQEITAVVAALDWEKDKVTLSIKAALPDPWRNLETRYPIGMIAAGQVTRLTDFGAFIKLEPGVEGPLHISKLGRGKKLKHPREAVKEGETIPVQIEKIDSDQRRISLIRVDGDEEEAPTTGIPEGYRPSLAKTMGTFGDLWPGKKKEGASSASQRRKQGDPAATGR